MSVCVIVCVCLLAITVCHVRLLLFIGGKTLGQDEGDHGFVTNMKDRAQERAQRERA